MAGIGRVLSDRKTHASNAGGIRAGKVVAMLQLNLGRDLDLAAQVHKERAVGNLANRKTSKASIAVVIATEWAPSLALRLTSTTHCWRCSWEIPRVRGLRLDDVRHVDSG
jgi:hypothetical protein